MRREKNGIWIHEGVRTDVSVLPVSEIFAKTAHFSKCKSSVKQEKRRKWIFTKIKCYGIIQVAVLGLLMRGAEIWEKI